MIKDKSMKPSMLYVLVAVLVIVGQHAVQPGGIGTGINEPVPGEVEFTTLSLSASTGSEVFARLSINEVPSFFINSPSTEQIDIPEGAQMFYNGDSLAILGLGPGQSALPASRYQFLLDGNGVFRFLDTSSILSVGQFGPGTLYYDGETALFTNSNFFMSFYESLAVQFPVPPSQVTISTPRVGNEIVLALQSNPVNSADGNVIELTGSDAFILGSGESLVYNSNSLRYRRGSVTQEVFDDTTQFYVLEDITQNGQRGRRLKQFSGSSNDVFTGPGILRVGTSPNDGQRVAFFSPSAGVNREITDGVVDGQLTFNAVQNSAQISDIFTNPGTPAPLIELNGARTFTYPTANRITYENGNIRVFDRFNQQLGSFFGYDLSSFLNHKIATTNGAVTRSFDIPDGGLTFISNSNDRDAFIYPSRNLVLTDRINQVRGMITITPEPFPMYSIASSSGSSVLSLNGDETVTITDRAPIIIGNGQSLNYDGTSLTVFSNAETGTSISGTPIAVDSLTTYVTPGNYLDTFSSSNTPSNDFSGPGVVYYDDQNRAFFTNDEFSMNFISGFLDNIPPVRIRTTTRTVSGRTFVDIVDPDSVRLVEGSTSTTTNLGPSQSIIYTDNTVSVFNWYFVPPSSTVRYIVSTVPGENNRVEVVSSDGDVVFSTSASSDFRYRVGGVLQPTPTTTTSYPGGGVLYFNSNTGSVIYNDATTSSTALINDLMTAGITVNTNTGNITSLSFFDGRTITRYTGSSTSVLPGPGTIFTSGNEGFYSTDSSTTTRLVQEITNNIPVDVGVNQLTGMVTIVYPGTQTSIFNFTTSSTRATINTGTTITYSNGVLMIPGRNITTTSFTYFNGITTQVFSTGDTVTFLGPGQVIVDEETNGIIFIDNENTNERITNVLTNIPMVPPVLARPTTTTFISKLGVVSPPFGQRVTVYESAVVNLRCMVLQSAPTPSFMFFRDGVALNGSETGIMIRVVSTTEQILSVNTGDFDAAGNYECRVRNMAGQDRIFSDIFTRPGVAPAIQNRFFPSSPELPGLTVTARDIDPAEVVNIIVRDRQTQNAEPNPDLLTNTVHIACKDDDGLPKSVISWFAFDSNGQEVAVNISDVFVPRAGRSILTVDTRPTLLNTRTITYQCTAENSLGEANGLVTIARSSYTCEDILNLPCSATCGFGIQSTVPFNCQVRLDEAIPASIDLSDVPVGLFEATLSLCRSEVLPFSFCPEITYEFNTTAFGDCSRTCGGGVEGRDVTCFRLVGGMRDMAVDDEDCIVFGLKRPAVARECSPQKCPRWVILSDYTPCSSSCAGGFRSRNVSCVQFTALFNETTGEFVCDADGNPIGNDMILDATNCFAGNMPRAGDACNTQIPCPRRWFPSAFGSCDADFCQQRSLSCTGFDPSDPGERWILDISECAGIPPPHTVRSCGGGTCSAGRWITENVGTCTVTCGIGNQQRNVFCESRNGSRINDGFCSPNERPSVFGRCMLFNCPGRCDFEPSDCPIYRIFGLCKSQGRPCCKSCPLQFVDDRPNLITRDDLVVSLDQDVYVVPRGTHVEVCCVASSSTPNAFLPFLFNCNFSNGEITREVMVGKVLDNTACVFFPTSSLAIGTTFNLTLSNDDMMVLDVANVTIV